MRRIILAAVFILALASPTLADTTHCTMREDEQAQRLVTMCTGGSRAMSHYDGQAQHWYTDIGEDARERRGTERLAGAREGTTAVTS